MRTLLQTAADYAISYLGGLEAQSVAPTPEAVARLLPFP